MSTMPSACFTFCSMVGRGTRSFSREKATSSPTVSPANWQSESCITVPTCALSLWMLCSRVSSPATFTLPVNSAFVENGSSPFRQLPNVDFPLPDGPRISTFSPCQMVRLMSCSVGFFCEAYRRVKFLNSMTGVAMLTPQKGSSSSNCGLPSLSAQGCPAQRSSRRPSGRQSAPAACRWQARPHTTSW